MRHWGWALIWLFIYGAIGGTALDAFHAYYGVERYSMPQLFGLLDWRVPLLFGGAAVAIGISHPLADALLHTQLHAQRRGHSLLMSSMGLIWLVLAYIIAALPIASWARAGGITLLYVVVWHLSGKGWQLLLLAALTAVAGTGIEMLLVRAGSFVYLQPDLGGVPLWLPCLYACASLVVGDLGQALYNSRCFHLRADSKSR